MKNKTPKSSRLTLTSQLYLGFSVVFVIAMLLLIFFLQSAIQVIGLNIRSQDELAQSRQVYTLEATLWDLEMAINRYEITGEESALLEYTARSTSIDDMIVDLERNASTEELQALARITDNKVQVDAIFTAIVNAFDAEDWDTLTVQDETLYKIIPSIDEDIKAITNARLERLEEFKSAVLRFQVGAFISLLVALPVILVAAFIAALIVNNRINQPFFALAGAAKEALAGRLELKDIHKLASRGDEMGGLAQEFLEMAQAISGRGAAMQAEAAEIKAKIR